MGRDAQTLVVVSPIPFEALAEEGLYERERFARWVEVLREQVEAAGGDLMDLHRALPRQEFRDDLGHYDRRGALIVSSHVQRWLRRAIPSAFPVASLGSREGPPRGSRAKTARRP